jgi:hypothetical protein
MHTNEATLMDWQDLIRSEYLEVPGLRLTTAQIRRMWGLDADTCEVVLEGLVSSRFLRRTRDGYARVDCGA